MLGIVNDAIENQHHITSVEEVSVPWPIEDKEWRVWIHEADRDGEEGAWDVVDIAIDDKVFAWV